MGRFVRILTSFCGSKSYRFYIFNRLGIYNWLSDERFLKKYYYSVFEKDLNLQKPETFNEKLQWLKLNDHNDKYTDMIDKVKVKSIVSELIGEEYIIPTIKVYDNAKQINFDELPNEVVLKCNHDSGSVFFVDKNSNRNKIIRKINRSLKKNYFWHDREWGYKNITPKILAEQYIGEMGNHNINDYKVFVFEGNVKYIQVDYDRFIDHHRNFYDVNWEYVPFTTKYPTDANRVIEKPECLEEMIIVSRRISDYLNNPKFFRVDFYVISGKLFFGEATFYHGGGTELFSPKEYDKYLGDLIHL